MMDKQFIPGWVILTCYPHVNDLNDLNIGKRAEFLMDMSIIGEAISDVVSDFKRMNYSILGNSDNYLHAHIYPRYNWESTDSIKYPVWLYDGDKYWRNTKYDLNLKHMTLANKIIDRIKFLYKCHNYDKYDE